MTRRCFGQARSGALALTTALCLLCGLGPAAVLAQPAPPAQAETTQLLGTWYSEKSRERLSFGRNGELWSCFEGKARDKVARGYWKELQPGRYMLYFTHIGLADCSFKGARERRMQVPIDAVAAINGERLEIFNSGEFPPDGYLRRRTPH